MAHISTIALQDRSRLVKLFTELTEIKAGSYDYNLAERLGNFVGLAGSMTLAHGLRELPADSIKPSAGDIASVRQDFLLSRQQMIQNIIESFSEPDADSQLNVPSIATGIRVEALRTFDPYQRFYTEHQIQMAVAVNNARETLRQSMTTISPSLYRLAELDRLLQDSLEIHTGKQFSLSIKILRQQFKTFLAQSNNADDEQWVLPFHDLMRELLLAELDTRLQPVLGLLEALNEHENNNE